MRFTSLAVLPITAVLAASPNFAEVGRGAHNCNDGRGPLRQVIAVGTVGGDRFSGEVRELSDEPGTSDPKGVWFHSSWGRERFHGDVDRLVGEPNGAFLITIRGTGRFDGVDGYEFQVVIQDREDRTLPDTYRLVVIDPDVPEVVFSSIGFFETGDVISICE